MAPAAAKIKNNSKISDYFAKAPVKKTASQSSTIPSSSQGSDSQPVRKKRPAPTALERPSKSSGQTTPKSARGRAASSESENETASGHSTRPTTPSTASPGPSNASRSPLSTSGASAPNLTEEEIPSSDPDEVEISITNISADLSFSARSPPPRPNQPAPPPLPPARAQSPDTDSHMTDGTLQPTTASALMTAASEAKTRSILENIRARAASKAETLATPLQLNGDDDSSSSDDDADPFSKIVIKRSAPEEPMNSRKAGLRAYNVPMPGPSSRSIPTPAPAARSSAFIDGLLREKKKQTKAGCPTNEEDRMAKIEATLAMLNRANMNGTDLFDDDEAEEAEEDRSAYAAMLGSKEAKRVGKFLESDKIGRQMERDNKLASTWTFWIQESDGVDEVMDSYDALPPLNVPSSCGPMLQAVAAAVHENDTSSLKAWLTSGLLSLEGNARTHLSRWLFSLVTGLHGLEWSDLAVACFETLQHGSVKGPSNVPWDELPRVLSSLGASSQALGVLQWVKVADLPPRTAPFSARSRALTNILLFVETAVRSGDYPLQAVPRLFTILLLLALDPSTSASLKLRISSILETLVASLPDSNEGNSTEFNICWTILGSSKDLSPSHRRQLLLLIPGGHARARRVMRAVANAWLVPGAKNTNTESYLESHSLDSIIGLLSSPPFALTEETDYASLLHLTEILNIALTELNGYFPSGTTVFRKRAPLEQLTAQLEKMENRIVDTRASHLDRTWVKDALLRLRMRIHYQTVVLLKDGSKITNYTKAAS